MPKFPNYKQADSKDCGPTCIKIVAKHFGVNIDIQKLREMTETTRKGSNMLLLSEAAENIGFKTLGVRISVEKLIDAPLPCILFWNKKHYVVLYRIKKNRYYISDPGFGLIDYGTEEFLKFWIGNNADISTEEGIALLVEPGSKLYKYESFNEDKSLWNFEYLTKYILRYKSFITQLIVGLLAGSILQLIAPFLTQSIVDIGIQNQNIHFIYLILIAQLLLFAGRTGLELIRSWILLHLSTRINISLISDFFIKLMNLPMSFFDVRVTGDIMQRISDHNRIERFLTTSSLSVLFSLFNVLIMGGVLAIYNSTIFLIFFSGSLLYFGWVLLFLKRREKLDYKRFSEISSEQSKVIELINGMQEIKLHNAERQKRWGWEYIQARIFKISLKSLMLEQTQYIGSNFINELKNIIIIFISAKLVIDGQITLGMMMAISSIVGSLNTPIIQLIEFIREAQDAKISFSRLAEIHDKEDEVQIDLNKSNEIPEIADIEVKDINFRYPSADQPLFKHLSLTISSNKVTAIVGASGSGKTTLMKILLKFYKPQKGEIVLNSPNGSNLKLDDISQKAWRTHVGSVMQEGYIFNDSIANNIALGEDNIDKKRLKYSTDVANIKSFIESMPLGYNTKIGMEGIGMSTGQKQRLLIARAVYRDPEILFFDEATSALDTTNEQEIIEKLNTFFNGKTVVIIAHRLSTVINADQIIVLDKGKMVEKGTHLELVKLKGYYYELIKNQLQLSNV